MTKIEKTLILLLLPFVIIKQGIKTLSKKKFLRRATAFCLASALILVMIPFTQTTADIVGLPGARSESNSYGDVFLGGNFIEVGISKHGSFGTSTTPVTPGWHNIYSYGVGLLSDGDGWNVGKPPQTEDFFLPGSPEERYIFSYYIGSSVYEYIVAERNEGIRGSWKTMPSVTDQSNISKGELKAVVKGVTIHDVELEIIYSFGVNDKHYSTQVNIVNKGSNDIQNARFVRSFDPDQDAHTKDDYQTYNKVISNPVTSLPGGEENFAMVVALGGTTYEGFFFLGFDNRARASRGVSFSPYSAYMSGLWDAAPVTDLPFATEDAVEFSPSKQNGYQYEDDAIAMTFALGTISAGKSDKFIYISSLDPDVKNTLRSLLKGKVDYRSEAITDLESDSTYYVTCDGVTYKFVNIPVDQIPLIGKAPTTATTDLVDYNFVGKTITIVKKNAEGNSISDELTIDIAARPAAPSGDELPTTPFTSPSLSSSDVSTTSTSITVTAKENQEYSIDGINWVAPVDGKVVFDELDPNTTFNFYARSKATNSAPASNPASVVVKTQPMLKDFNFNKVSFSGTYDGSEHFAAVTTEVKDVSIKYSKTLDGTYTSDFVKFKNAGTYTVYYWVEKEGNYPAYGTLSVTINKKEIGINWGATSFVYDGTAKLPTATATGLVGSDTGTLTITGEKINAGNYTATATNFSNSNYKLPLNNTTEFSIASAVQTAPVINKANESISGKADGKITGVDSTMEYRKEGEATYTSISASEVANLPAGKYYVRYKTKTNYTPSNDTEVIISQGKKLDITTPTTQAGYTFSVSNTQVDYNGSTVLSISFKEGYEPTSSFVVKVNGLAVDLSSGSFTLTNIKSDSVITVEGVADSAAPTAEISLNSHRWNKFLNVITFGLFFKDTQTVSVTSADVGSGVKTTEYYISNVAVSDITKVTTWTTYSNSLSINPTNNYVVYVKVTDNAGNVTYVSSDGVVLDNTAPTISGVENGATYYGDTKVKVEDSNISKVTVNGKTVEVIDGYITITPNNGENFIVVTDKIGNESSVSINVFKKYTVKFKADGKYIDTVVVNHSFGATAPTIPEKEGYNQVAPTWDIAFDNVTSDLEVTAVYTINKYKISVPKAQVGYTLTTSVSEVNWGESFTYTFKIADGYSKTEKFAITANCANSDISNSNEVNFVTTDIELCVAGVEDITAPIAQIELKDNTWKSLLNTITFNLFFKEKQTVTVTAEDVDTGSGIKTIEYFVANTKVDVTTISTWESYTKAFDIAPNAEIVVYVKVTDNSGNVTYISSEGLVLDDVAPAITEIEDGKTYYGDTNIKITDLYLDKVTLDGVEVDLENDFLSIVADNEQHTINVTDKSGNETNYTISVFKKYNVTFVVDDKTLEVIVVNHGFDIEKMPAVPHKVGFDDASPTWDKDGKNIIEDTTITAVYTKNEPGVYNDSTSPENFAGAKLVTPIEELKDLVPFTEEELLKIEQGEDVNLWLELRDISDTVLTADKKLIKDIAGDMKIGAYLDGSVFKKIGSGSQIKVNELNGMVTIQIKIPEELINKDPNIIRTYKMIRVHEGVAEILDAQFNAKDFTLTFQTDRFSTYSIAYDDVITGETKNPEPDNDKPKTDDTKSPNTGVSNYIQILLALAFISGVTMLAGFKVKVKAKEEKLN